MRGFGTATALVGALVVAGGARQLISVQQEVQLGAEAQKQVKAEVPAVTDLRVTNFVTGAGKRLSARAGGPRYPYSFSVANYREINAFALPGGPVWINRGAISAAGTEGQFASVLAHEVAHIAQRHAASQITKNLVANGLLGLLGAMLGNDGGGARTAQLVAQAMAGGYMLKFSRDDEREADRVGAQIMERAGYDPREMIAFMETLRAVQGRDPTAVETFLTSHPAPGERADLLRTQLRRAYKGQRDSGVFKEIKQRLNRLPAAKSMPRR